MVERINIEKLGMKSCRYLQVYLPRDYQHGNFAYDVIYMHDGHNLFDVETSAFAMVWGIDKIMERREANGNNAHIVVGIECPSMDRFSLYSPWKCSFDRQSIYHNLGGRGDVYASWIVKKIIPFIDCHYLTNKRRYMAGSSMGGIISLYSGMKYPSLYRAVGVMSPAIWFAKGNILESVSKIEDMVNIYVDIGHCESSDSTIQDFPSIYLNDTRQLVEVLSKNKLVNLKYIEDELGKHNELAWARRFGNFLDYIENLH